MKKILTILMLLTIAACGFALTQKCVFVDDKPVFGEETDESTVVFFNTDNKVYISRIEDKYSVTLNNSYFGVTNSQHQFIEGFDIYCGSNEDYDLFVILEKDNISYFVHID